MSGSKKIKKIKTHKLGAADPAPISTYSDFVNTASSLGEIISIADSWRDVNQQVQAIFNVLEQYRENPVGATPSQINAMNNFMLYQNNGFGNTSVGSDPFNWNQLGEYSTFDNWSYRQGPFLNELTGDVNNLKKVQ